jgi:hypothetical protein
MTQRGYTCSGGRRHVRRRRATAVLCLLASAALARAQSNEGPPETETERRARLSVRLLEADVAPTFDVTLPSGNVHFESSEQLAGLRLRLRTDYNFLDNRIGADFGFFYPVRLFEPGVIFFDSVDFENTVEPKIDGLQVSLAPREKFIARRRGVEVRIGVHPTSALAIVPAFVVAEVFEGSLTALGVEEDALYLTPRLAVEYDTMTSEDLEEDLFIGVELRSSLDWRFREGFSHAVDLSHETSLAVFAGNAGGSILEERIRLAYPLVVWESERTNARYFSLGGVDSVRGYEPASFHAFRYALLQSDLRPAVLKRLTIPLRLGKKRSAKIHRFRLLVFSDVAATQESLDLKTPPKWHATAGVGFSFLLSGDRGNHFRTRLYLAAPLLEPPVPIFYWQTSLFTVSKRF